MANSKIVKFKDKKGNEYPYLYIDEMTDEYYAVKRIGKTVKKKPLGKEFVKARAQVLNAIHELSNERPKIKGNKLIKDFYPLMIEDKIQLSIKASTLTAIEGVWRRRIEPYWGHLMADDITQAQITEFMKWHRRKLPSVQFVNTFKYLGNIFNVMVERGALEIQKVPNLIIPLDEQKHHEKEKGRYITPEEITKILESTAGNEDYIYIATDYALGFRKTEWAEVTKDKVVLEGDHYVIKFDTDDTKTGMAREVPLPRALTERITQQMAASDSKFLFPMKSDHTRPIYSKHVDDFWAAAKKKAKVKGRIRIHDNRHSAARNFAKANVNPIVACTILGMSLATYQKVYCKLKASDLKMAVEQSAALAGVA
jgi:integrase